MIAQMVVKALSRDRVCAIAREEIVWVAAGVHLLIEARVSEIVQDDHTMEPSYWVLMAVEALWGESARNDHSQIVQGGSRPCE